MAQMISDNMKIGSQRLVQFSNREEGVSIGKAIPIRRENDAAEFVRYAQLTVNNCMANVVHVTLSLPRPPKCPQMNP